MPYQKSDKLISKAKAHFAARLPFSLYRKPFATMVSGMFQEDDTLNILQKNEESGFVFAPFDTSLDTILLQADTKLSGEIPENEKQPSSLEVDFELGKDYHLSLVKHAISEIKKGTLRKVVVSRKTEIETHQNPIDLFSSILSKYNSAFCFLFFHPKVGCWLGATPERLLSIKNGQFETNALAGTLPFETGKDPIWSTKEFEEQQMVTDYIVQRLQELDLRPKIDGPKNKMAGKLWHLNSIIQGEIGHHVKIMAILEKLHPTPAVCGLPTFKAREFIMKNENYQRGFYTGYMGEFNVNGAMESDLYVNLRSMQLTEKKAIIYVGGGITKDSDPENEWKETVNKSRTMLDLF